MTEQNLHAEIEAIVGSELFKKYSQELTNALGKQVAENNRLREFVQSIVDAGHDPMDDDCYYACPKSPECCNYKWDDVPIEERPCYCLYDRAVAALGEGK